jgi:hypothetical protein
LVRLTADKKRIKKTDTWVGRTVKVADDTGASRPVRETSRAKGSGMEAKEHDKEDIQHHPHPVLPHESPAARCAPL